MQETLLLISITHKAAFLIDRRELHSAAPALFLIWKEYVTAAMTTVEKYLRRIIAPDAVNTMGSDRSTFMSCPHQVVGSHSDKHQ